MSKLIRQAIICATIVGALTFSISCKKSTKNVSGGTTSPLTGAGVTGLVVTASGPYKAGVGSVPGCPGAFNGSARMTNSNGSVWFTPSPSTITSGTISDPLSPGTYTSAVEAVRRRDGMKWCGVSTVTFPAAATEQYEFNIYITSPTPPPTANQILSLNVTWQ